MAPLAVVVLAIPLAYGFLSDDVQDLFDIDMMQFSAALIATAGYIAADPDNRKARAIMFLISVWSWWISISDSLLPWVPPAVPAPPQKAEEPPISIAPPGLSAIEAVIALAGLLWIVRRESGAGG